MNAVALYTFGLLNSAVESPELDDFARRGGEILAASDDAPGFLGRASREDAEGEWGSYFIPEIPEFFGHDRNQHIATLSLWQDVETARRFVYEGFHRDALRLRYDWFLKGSWPGYVLWEIKGGATPTWSDGVARYQALARSGESADRFSFASRGHRA